MRSQRIRHDWAIFIFTFHFTFKVPDLHLQGVWWHLNCQHPLDHQKSKSSRKTSTSALLSMPKPLTMWITTNWKILKEMGVPDHLTTDQICMQVKKQQLELDGQQQTGSKWGKDYIKAAYCHPAYLTYMQCTSWETLGWRKHKLESRLLGEISIT